MKIMCTATKRLSFSQIFYKLLKNKGTYEHSKIISGILPHEPIAWQIFPKKESHMTFIKKGHHLKIKNIYNIITLLLLLCCFMMNK